MESSPSLAPAQEWLHSLLLEATEATVSRSGLALPRCSALKGARLSAMALLCPVGGRHLSGWTYAGDLYVVTAGLFCVPSCCRCRQLWLVKYGGTQGWQCHPSVHHQSRLARSLGMLQITLSPCQSDSLPCFPLLRHTPCHPNPPPPSFSSRGLPTRQPSCSPRAERGHLSMRPHSTGGYHRGHDEILPPTQEKQRLNCLRVLIKGPSLFKMCPGQQSSRVFSSLDSRVPRSVRFEQCINMGEGVRTAGVLLEKLLDKSGGLPWHALILRPRRDCPFHQPGSPGVHYSVCGVGAEDTSTLRSNSV